MPIHIFRTIKKEDDLIIGETIAVRKKITTLGSLSNVNYWTDAHIVSLRNVKKFEDLHEISLSVLKSMPTDKPIVQVCGPLTTGGLENEALNTVILKSCIIKMQIEGYNVFDQLPLGLALRRLVREWKRTNSGYCKPILKIFKEIFKSGFIEETSFIPGYKKSEGSRWEKLISFKLDIKISEFPFKWYKEILEGLQVSKFSG